MGKIYTGIGGWTYEPWRGNFYPEGLTQKKELHYASRQLTSIEINGTFYSTFKPDSWIKWREETPENFVFSMKASRYCTNRKELGNAGPSIEKFIQQGIEHLHDRLGPINWQLAATKKFDAADIEAFFSLLPKKIGKRTLRHALEVRHESFKDAAFYKLAKKYNIAIVIADDETFPSIIEPTADFTYARLMRTEADIETGYNKAQLKQWEKRAKEWAKNGDVFIYFISGAKERNPAAAMAFIDHLK